MQEDLQAIYPVATIEGLRSGFLRPAVVACWTATVVLLLLAMDTVNAASLSISGNRFSQDHPGSMAIRFPTGICLLPHDSWKQQCTAWFEAPKFRDPVSLTPGLLPEPGTAAHAFFINHPGLEDLLEPPSVFIGLSLLNPAPEEDTVIQREVPAERSGALHTGTEWKAQVIEAALEFPIPRVPAPWVFKGNGGRGVKTWLSEAHVLEINPRWLNFGMFDSMDLSMTERPPGPGQSEPQEWRSTFTVGLSTDWRFTRAVALHAGYRFYDNPVPSEITSAAFPNASQHVMAVGMSVREGQHSLALIYGLDLMEASVSSGISTARQGQNLDPVAHLVSLTYGFTF